jgi:hypothetical protein
MPSKKGKKSTKKATVDKSTKQTVRQSVVVNVNTRGDSKPKKKRQSATNVKSFTKGMTYMAGTPHRAISVAPMMPHDTVNQRPMQQPMQQPIFQSDMVNRITALENMRMSQLTDQQQAMSMVTPLATQSPTALKPIGLMETPELLKTPNVDVQEETMQKLNDNRQQDVDDLKTIMGASSLFDNPLHDELSPPPEGETYAPSRIPKAPFERSPIQTRSRTASQTDEAETSAQGAQRADSSKKLDKPSRNDYEGLPFAELVSMHAQRYPNAKKKPIGEEAYINSILRYDMDTWKRKQQGL